MPGQVLLEPGKRIGRFEIQQAVHSTEVSATYKAHDPDYERTVALKLVYETDKAAIESHLAAARVASKLDHENIAATHGGGQLQGGVLLVSEYHEGLALGTRLTRKEAFAWTEVLDIARQLCAAIDYSRTRQAIHKRLHPGNLQVGWDGSIKILDYGSGPATHDSYTGWAYMAPEQVRGDEASSASNLFSLSAILYQIVVGEAPFAGETVAALKEQILQCKPKPPKSLKPNLPEGIASALLRGLAANPADRFAMGLDFCAELERNRFWNPAVAAPIKPKEPPAELTRPFVIGVKPMQPAPGASGQFAAGTGSGSGAFAGGTGIQAAAAQAAPSGQTGITMRLPVSPQSGNNALEMVSTQETVYQGQVTPAAAPPQEKPVQQPALDPTVRPRPENAIAHGSSTKIRPQTGLPPLPPVARAGMQVDHFLTNVKKAAVSPKKPFAWGFAFAAVILLLALATAAIVQLYPFQHKSPAAANDGNAAAAPVPAQPPVASGSAAAPVTPDAQQSTEPQLQADEPQEKANGTQRKGKTKAKATPVVVAAAAPMLGTIEISVTPNDAQVFMDGAALMSGGGAKQVSPGRHSFTMSRPGYGNETRLADIAVGRQTNLSVRMNPQAAMVSLNTSPEGANIYVDGKDTGKLSPAEITVSEGSHQVTLRKYGFLDSVNTANARLGEKAVITVTLQPTSTEPVRTVGGGMHKLFGGGVPSGMVRVKFVSSPQGAQVQINGQLLDKTTPVEAALKPGKYQVDIMADGYHTDHKVVTVGDDKKMEVSSVLQRF